MPQKDRSTAERIAICVVVAVIVVAAVILFVASGHSTGDSGEGQASALFSFVLGTKSALAAGPPPVPPVYPGGSIDASGEGTADDAPPPEEVPEGDDNGTEVNDDGTAVTNTPEPTSNPNESAPKPPEPAATTTTTPVAQPEPPRAGYCDAQGKFYELVVDQFKTDPYWAAKGPWTDVYTDSATGAITCDFPKKEEETQPTVMATTTAPVKKPAEVPVAPVRTGFITIKTPGYDSSTSFRVNIYESLKNGTKLSQQRRLRNNETIAFKLPPGATTKVKFNGAKCAGWYLKGTTPSSLHWVYEATYSVPSDDPKCKRYLSPLPK
ncbi:hypothetical protein KW803_03885 [Candidatus Saccharibacteria bacterium]|nr:hypothetical protein [Candidatus Saccharibacteria bacterium]